MKKLFERVKWKMYCNLSRRLTELIPEEYGPSVDVVPSTKEDDKDIVIIGVRIPHSVTRKLMWHFKVWR